MSRPGPLSQRRFARLLLAGLLLLTVLALGGPGVARAQDAPAASDDPLAGSDSPTAKGPARNEWALTPTGDNPAEPGSRPNLSYELAPGATVHDSVTVWNYSDQQLAFRIYARDAFNTPSGGFDLLRRDQDSTDAGSWITLEQNSMIVPPHSGIASARHRRGSGRRQPRRPRRRHRGRHRVADEHDRRQRRGRDRASRRLPRLRPGGRCRSTPRSSSTRCTRSTTAACSPPWAASST